MKAAAYIKIKENLFYKITTGSVEVVNTERGNYRNSGMGGTLPSAYMRDVTVITQDEFEKAKKQIGL